MRILVLKDANDDKVNKKCYQLEEDGYVIIDIVYTPETAGHYVSYAVIKYRLKRI